MFFKINSNCYTDEETKLSWEPKSFQQLSFQGAHIYIFLFLLFFHKFSILNLLNCDSFLSLEILCKFYANLKFIDMELLTASSPISTGVSAATKLSYPALWVCCSASSTGASLSTTSHSNIPIPLE